jgi:hypothetical protein
LSLAEGGRKGLEIGQKRRPEECRLKQLSEREMASGRAKSIGYPERRKNMEKKKLLMIIGDYVEDYEVMMPFQIR